MTLMATLKHESFSEEREWRLIGVGGDCYIVREDTVSCRMLKYFSEEIASLG